MSKKKIGNENFALGRENYLLLVIGFAIIVLGFILMIGGKSEDPTVFNEEEIFSFRRITLAPLVVLAGFIFEIWAIMKRPKSTGEND
jgi:membrane-bound ClpP family serine protease